MTSERSGAPDSVYSGQHVFRRTFLIYLEPEMVEALSRVGDAFFNLVLEHASSVLAIEPSPPSGESPTNQRLRGALADLRYLESVLSSVGREHLDSGLTTEETELSLFAGGLTGDLSKLCDRLAERLDALTTASGTLQGQVS